MATYILQLVVWMVFIAALVFWPAGTLAYPAGWVFVGLFAVGGLAMVLWLGRYDPHLLRERMASPLQRAQAPWDRVWLLTFMVAFCAWLAFMSWDAARTGFGAVPLWLQVVGAAGILLDYAGTFWTFRENSFAAPVVKVQQSQRVIDTGPYAFVRHPMYASALFLLLGMPLLLGSWFGLALAVVFILGVAWRAVHEEEALREGLPGYADYAARVRYRFIPFVW
jgi:protein-S-isoprenylcysteine O-methyltransferase Ste14